jgi:hypothetical protein
LIFAVSKTLNYVITKKLRFVIIKPFGVNSDVNLCCISGLAFVRVLMYIY